MRVKETLMQHVSHAAQPSRIASSRWPGTSGAPGGGAVMPADRGGGGGGGGAMSRRDERG